MTPKDFFNAYYADAQKCMQSTGVPASITLAQAAFESGWGDHAPGNNFFGEKARAGWTGATVLRHTWECGKTGIPASDGLAGYDIVAKFAPTDPNHPKICEGYWAYLINDKFRAYATPADSFIDHGAFLKSHSRYSPCFGGDYKQFAVALHKGGYSTEPDYDQLLIKMIEDHKLYLCDKI